MSGAALVFDSQYDDSAITAALKRLLAAGGDLRPALVNIGEYLVQATEERFRTETDPDGNRWPEVTDATRKRKRHPKILTESGQLRQSIHYRAAKSQVKIGTNKPYAAAHQFGVDGPVPIPRHKRRITRVYGRALRFPVWAEIPAHTIRQHIPARPFLGVSETDRREILTIIEDHIQMAVK